ncbi:MAG: hypothetical protein IT162_15485 [Bryobacterales bacterium]|nr:hypothetical protein [Bryobacterales bacterium]
MTLHPDILNDLVSLYHAGEAAAASRALLEDETSRNPALTAALAGTAQPMAPLPVNLGPAGRRACTSRFLVLFASGLGALCLLERATG